MTSWWGWALRRARASTGLLLTLLALVTATTAILAGAVGYSGAAATTAARQALTDTVPTEAGIRVQTRQAEDPDAQDAAARARIAEAFGEAPVAVQRTVASEPRAVQLDGSALDGRLVVLSSPALSPEDPDVAERVEIVEGDWPVDGSEPVQGLLHAATAAEWEVTVGDTLQVGSNPVTVTGLWRPVDAADAYWFGDRLVAAGRDDAQRGPLVVAPGAVAQIVDSPFVRWTVQPDATAIQPEDLAPLSAAAASLRDSLKTPEVDVRGVTVDGDLAPTAATASTNLATASALGVIPLSVLALVTVLAIVQLARLLATTREAQAQLLVARGASRAQVLTSTLVESALVTVVGAALGGLLARGVLQTVPAGEAQGPTVVRVALVTGAGVLLVLAAVAVLQVRRLTTGGAADLSGRTRAATALATVVLVLGAAGVAWWQLRRSGSPLVTKDDGALGTDLVAGAAPALLLAAAAVVAMALLGPATRLVETLTRPTRTASGHLAASQVSRRLTVYAVPAVLTVLAVGATTVSGLYAGTSATLRDDLATVAEGAPVRATLAPAVAVKDPGVVAPPPPDFTEIPGLTRSVTVWQDPNATLADLTVPVTMAHLEDLTAVADVPDLGAATPLIPTEALASDGFTSEGVPVPAGTRTIEVIIEGEVDVPESTLEMFQGMYEQGVVDTMAGEGMVVIHGVDVDEELARTENRRHLDWALTGGDPFGGMDGEEAPEPPEPEPFSWDVRLTFVNPETGQLHAVDGGSVEFPRFRVEPPPAEDLYASYLDSEVTPGVGRASLIFTLPEGSEQVLHEVALDLAVREEMRWDPVNSELDLSVRAVTDTGVELFGDATAGWGSPEAAPPEVVEERRVAAEEMAGETGYQTQILPDGSVVTYGDTVFVPAELDTTGTAWQLRGRPGQDLGNPVTVAPGTEWVDPSVRPGQDAPVPRARAAQTLVPVALTAQAASAANLSEGDPAQIKAFGATIPVTVAAVVPAVPGTLAPQAVLVERDEIAALLAEAGRALPHPQELWARTDPGQESAVVEALAGEARITEVSGPGGVTITDATSAARLVFWVASAGAVLLAVTGIAAVAATLLGQRRPEVAVLRALGMPPGAQAHSRATELGGVVVASVLLGLGAGWLVGRAVVPELARSTTLRGQVSLPADLVLEPGLWAALLGLGALAVLAVVLVQAGRVRRQALDNDYREEIR